MNSRMASTWRSRGRSGHCTHTVLSEWNCWCDIRAACPKLLQGRPVQVRKACVAVPEMQHETPANSPSRYLYLERPNSQGKSPEKLHLPACSQALQKQHPATHNTIAYLPLLTMYAQLLLPITATTTSYWTTYYYILPRLLLPLRRHLRCLRVQLPLQIQRHN